MGSMCLANVSTFDISKFKTDTSKLFLLNFLNLLSHLLFIDDNLLMIVKEFLSNRDKEIESFKIF